jgi:hypothetical protein
MNVGLIRAEITSKVPQTASVKTNFVRRNIMLAALKELAARWMLLSKFEDLVHIYNLASNTN